MKIISEEALETMFDKEIDKGNQKAYIYGQMYYAHEVLKYCNPVEYRIKLAEYIDKQIEAKIFHPDMSKK